MSQPGASQLAEALLLNSDYCTRLNTAPLKSFFLRLLLYLSSYMFACSLRGFWARDSFVA